MTPLAFGRFVLDLEARQLLRGGEPVALSPKAFQLLELLVENRPKAMAKAALLDCIWPETFVVEKNLVNLIAELRDALGDDHRNPEFIRTVQRFGYAFRSDDVPTVSGFDRREPARCFLVWPGGRANLHDGSHVLGRDPDLEVFLDLPGVSRRHARITVSPEQGAVLEDLDSKNGTFVAGRRVLHATRLADGDRLGVGSMQLTFKEVRRWETTRTELDGREAGGEND